MTFQAAVDTAVKRVVSASHPAKIILFGSQARGTGDAESDLDLLIVEKKVPSKIKEMARLRRAIGNVGMAVDVLVCSEYEVSQWGGVPGTAIYWALQEGRVLYEAAR